MGESASVERRRLLELVADHFLANGLSNVSLSALARAVGSNNRMLLYYFGTKARLFDEAGWAALARFPGIGGLVDELTFEGDVADVLERAWLRIAAEENRPFLRLFFESFWLNARRSAFEPAYLAHVGAWRRSISELLRRRGFEPTTADELALAVVAIWRGLQHELVAGVEPDRLRTAHRTAIEAMLRVASAATAR